MAALKWNKKKEETTCAPLKAAVNYNAFLEMPQKWFSGTLKVTLSTKS